MSSDEVSVVLVHGAWADGSSWAKIIAPLAADGAKVTATPLPLTSFRDDVAALDRTLERGKPGRLSWSATPMLARSSRRRAARR
jgi:hypothetical protein